MDSFAPTTDHYGDKTQRVLAAIRLGGMSAADIASSTKCSIPLVYQVARAQGIKISSGRKRDPNLVRSKDPKPLKNAKALLSSTAAVEILTVPLLPAPHREQAENREARLRLTLAKQLEEILARQRRIWGDLP